MAEGFGDLIRKWWNNTSPACCEAFILSIKVLWLKDNLNNWHKTAFGYLKLHKLSILHELENLNISKESQSLTLVELAQGTNLHLTMNETLNKKNAIGGDAHAWPS